MGNTLKMDKQDLLGRLFKTGWSNRKIKRTTGIHRRTIAKYRKDWKSKQMDFIASDCSPSNSKQSLENDSINIHNAPLEGASKCPPTPTG